MQGLWLILAGFGLWFLWRVIRGAIDIYQLMDTYEREMIERDCWLDGESLPEEHQR